MKKKRLFGVLLSLALMLTMMPALSQTAYAYDYAETWIENQTVSTSREINGDVFVKNDIILRIADGKTLTVNGVIVSPPSDKKTLTVKGPGKLIVNGMGGNNAFSGNIIVKGADVKIIGKDGSNGQQPGGSGTDGGWAIYGNVTVDDGSIKAIGGKGGNGADGNEGGNGGYGGFGIYGDLTVNGGSALASGGNGGNGGSGTPAGSPGEKEKAVSGNLTGTTIKVSSDGVNYSPISSGTTSDKQYVKATGTDPVSVKLDVGAGHADLFTDAVLAKLVDYKNKDDADIKIDASYATISGNVITITGIAATKLDKAMWNALDSFFVELARDYSIKGYITVGYNTIDNYASIEAINADISDERHNAPVSEGLTYYALWKKPYTKLEIDNGNPTCGKEPANCMPKMPDGIELLSDGCAWKDQSGVDVDSFKGGKEYTFYAEYKLNDEGALWKYYFDSENFNVSIKDGVDIGSRVKSSDVAIITFKATADHDWDEGKVTKEPTTTSEGEKTYTCKTVDCGATKKETIPKIKPTPTPPPTPSKKTARTVLVAKALSAGNTKAKVSWNNAGADRYVVYYGICGKSMKKYKTVNGKTRFVTVSKLRRGGMYKFRIVAQKKSGKSYKNIATSGYAHMTPGNVCGRYTNVKDLKVNRKALNLSKGRSFTVKTSLSKVRKNKRLFNLSHDPAVRYITDDPGVAVVNSKGKITAKGKGTCYVYVQAVNGIWKTVKVTVR